MIEDGRPPLLHIRQDFFVPTIVHDTNATVPAREMTLCIHKSKTDIVNDAIVAHKDLSGLVYDLLPDDMTTCYKDRGQYPTIAQIRRMDFIAAEEQVSYHVRSCVRQQYPDTSTRTWNQISRLFITEVRYHNQETLCSNKATDARAFVAKATCAHVQVQHPTVDTEANAVTTITREMQLAIDEGVAKGLASSIST